MWLIVFEPATKAVCCVWTRRANSELDRTNRVALKKGRCGTMTHDYKRNGVQQRLVCGVSNE